MAKDKINEATSVASSRSRLGNEKTVPKLKPGEAHQEQFLNFLIKKKRKITFEELFYIFNFIFSKLLIQNM